MAQSRPEESEETQGTQGKRPSLWRNRDYLYWWSGNGLSTLGTSVSTLAFPLLMLYATGSATQAGTITVLHMLGKLGTLAVGGALADRVSRRAILCLVPLVEAVSMAAVALLVYRGDPPVLGLDALALVSGLAAGLKVGVSTPVLRRIVPKEQIATATAQGMGRDMVVQLVGAPLGGLLYSMARWIPFLFDAVSFVFITLSSLFIRRPLGPDRHTDGERRTGLAEDMKDGLRLIRRSDYLVFTLAWGALLNTVAQGLTLLFVVLVRHRGGGPTAVGVATSLAVAGGVIGAVAGPWLMRRLGARRVLMLSAWVFVASFAVVALVPEPWQIGLVLMAGMVSMVPMNVVIESYEVRLVPDAYLGRVAATSQFFFQALQWIGPLAAGVLADALGVEAAVLILAVAMALLALALHTARRQLSVLDIPLAEVVELPPPPPAAGRPSETEPVHPHDGGSTLQR
ncbi:major facilitator superfamily MFS_1 [Streptomyces bingchenggensis BCW-1]|uniref:Major facilitator superfamily MFS_1 n=1 Tax=Streptomyces bingchenggensis (strain BCW-1) TaxID=749414 RepID=D7C413_STRBB|nr:MULTISPECIES: MFS transporter [Streptomyces]ADI12379.1 major facilitator superfamily MFS_1 [Streptomyces bingchenggensis BCW-1]